MFSKFAAALCASLAFALPSLALAHAGEDDGHDDARAPLDCEKLPANALRALPPPINDWGQLMCVPSGQMLVQGEHWTWRYPASFTTPVHVAAWSAEPAAASAEALYFVAANVAVARGDAARALESKVTHDLTVYTAMNKDKPPPSQVYTLTAVNSAGHRFDVHFLYRSDQDIWGLVCTPECSSTFSFILNSKRQ